MFKILVVEDDTDLNRTVMILLQNSGDTESALMIIWSNRSIWMSYIYE